MKTVCKILTICALLLILLPSCREPQPRARGWYTDPNGLICLPREDIENLLIEVKRLELELEAQ